MSFPFGRIMTYERIGRCCGETHGRVLWAVSTCTRLARQYQSSCGCRGDADLLLPLFRYYLCHQSSMFSMLNLNQVRAIQVRASQHCPLSALDKHICHCHCHVCFWFPVAEVGAAVIMPVGLALSHGAPRLTSNRSVQGRNNKEAGLLPAFSPDATSTMSQVDTVRGFLLISSTAPCFFFFDSCTLG